MLSEELLSEAIQEFLEYSHTHPEQIHSSAYEIYQSTEDGRMGSTRTVAVPSASNFADDPPDEVPKVRSLLEAIISDDDIPLIQSQSAATSAFNRIIEEIRIESNRGEPDALRNDPEYFDALHSEEAKIEWIAPIIGLSFDGEIRLHDSFVIRPLSHFEKERMLNSRALGGGSVTLRRAIQTGVVSHAAVYEHTSPVGDGWEAGIGILSDNGNEVHGAFEDLKLALRLTHPEGLQMRVRHVMDKTFYPAIISSQEEHGTNEPIGMTDPEPAANADKIVDYYQLVSKTNEDEGLRVAIDRLESSFQKLSNQDGIVDAVIGIEALLSSGRGESFQAVRRRAAVLARDKATYSDLGRLQNLRNATVHGEETQPDSKELKEARDLLTVLLDRMITETNEKGIGRSDMIQGLDNAITQTIETQFDELLSEYESE